MRKTGELKRVVGLPALVFFGVGTMVGAGYYALLGEVAQESGVLVPVALGVAGLIALISGFSFAELVSRYPVSAGIERYVDEAFDRRWLSRLVGLLVIATGLVSAATLAVATEGFLSDLSPLAYPRFAAIAGIVALLTLVASWGITQSVALVVATTTIEVGTLVIVFILNAHALPELPTVMAQGISDIPGNVWVGVFAGAFLAFYAFIGFEDMVPMAEEAVDPRRKLPAAILLSVAITTLIYVAVSLAGIAAVPVVNIAEAKTPIAQLVTAEGAIAGIGVGIVSLLTGINGALAQIIMVSRVAFGMARRKDAPKWLDKVNPLTRTPLRATVSLSLLVLLMALFLPLQTLAEITSAIVLAVFAVTNLALWRIKGRDPDPDGEGPRYPRWVSMLGFVSCIGVLAGQVWLKLPAN